MKKLNKYCMIAGLIFSMLSGNTIASAEITSNSWVDSSMVKVIEGTEPMNVAVLGSGANYLGYWSMSEKSDYYVIPLKVQYDGNTYISIKVDNLKEGSISCGLYEDVKLTKEVEKTASLSKKQSEIYEDYYLKAGTYYLAMDKRGDCRGTSVKGVIGALVARSDNRTIKPNKGYYGYFKQDNHEIYYKMELEESGYIKVNSSKEMNITLCNSDKTAISNVEKTSSSDLLFGVSKGTYYLKLSGTKGQFSFETKFTEKKITTNSMDTAKSIDINQTIKGLLSGNDSKDGAYWVKLDLKKESDLKLVTSWLGGSGKLNVNVFYNGNVKMYFNNFYLGDSKKESILKLAGDKKWPAGTYYISVSRENTLSTGLFEITFENAN